MLSRRIEAVAIRQYGLQIAFLIRSRRAEEGKRCVSQNRGTQIEVYNPSFATQEVIL